MNQEKHPRDPEAACAVGCSPENDADDGPVSAFKQLGLLDRFLAVWIFLAMAVGIILGNFVPNTSETLQRGKFVDVSVPIGESARQGNARNGRMAAATVLTLDSGRAASHDVSDPVQSAF
jgi:hypothetical protein